MRALLQYLSPASAASTTTTTATAGTTTTTTAGGAKQRCSTLAVFSFCSNKEQKKANEHECRHQAKIAHALRTGIDVAKDA